MSQELRPGDENAISKMKDVPSTGSLHVYLFGLSGFNPQRCKVFFVTLRTRGGGRFTPSPANSETKEAKTMKLCTIIAYYIASITKQLKFLNFNCSIVCSYCSFLILITKMS